MTATTIGDRRRWVLAVLDEYEVPLARFAGRLLGDLDAARDVVQHVFLRLCGQSEEEIGDRLAPWLFTVCRNRAIDVLRGRQRIEPLLSAEVPGRESDPAVTAQQNETYRQLNALVDELPLKHREVLGLWMEGLAYGRIAEITGHSEGNVRVLVHRALKRLREHPDVRRLLDLPVPLSWTHIYCRLCHRQAAGVSWDKQASFPPGLTGAVACCLPMAHEATV